VCRTAVVGLLPFSGRQGTGGRGDRQTGLRNLLRVDDRPANDDPGGLTLTVLGCSGTYAGPGGACSGYLLRSPGATVVVDLGSGTLANLQRHVDPRRLDAVVLTHEHPDHWLDLPLLRNALRYVLGGRNLAVYGTAGTHRMARAVISELAPTFVWQAVDAASVVEVGDLRLRFSATDHPVETLAVRADCAAAGGDRTLVYSADTGPAWDAHPLAGDVDLLLCEASFAPADEARHQHLSARQAGSYATVLGAGRLVVTHVPPGVDPDDQRRLAARTFDGPIDVAEVGRTFRV
jgi:ribonuclease BN (tRNA processing enzyme)